MCVSTDAISSYKIKKTHMSTQNDIRYFLNWSTSNYDHPQYVTLYRLKWSRMVNHQVFESDTSIEYRSTDVNRRGDWREEITNQVTVTCHVSRVCVESRYSETGGLVSKQLFSSVTHSFQKTTGPKLIIRHGTLNPGKYWSIVEHNNNIDLDLD